MNESIVFMGSGPVAAKSLEMLAKNFDVETVITKPKPDHHRGEFPVITVAKKLGIPMEFVQSKSDLNNLISKKSIKSKLGIIIDFGIIVSQEVIDYFPLGIVNSHFSLLPQWRGADPITFSILSGQEKTGVSLMVIDAGMDTGKLITYKSLKIAPEDTTETLTEKLIDLSDTLLTEYLPKYVTGEVKPKNQPHPDRATYSRKINKEDGLIDWSKPADQIEREIRAFVSWPKSRTSIGGKEIIITKAHAIPSDVQGTKIGTVEAVGNALMVQCGKDSSLCVDKLKPAGKAEMTAMAFIAGYRNLLR